MMGFIVLTIVLWIIQASVSIILLIVETYRINKRGVFMYNGSPHTKDGYADSCRVIFTSKKIILGFIFVPYFTIYYLITRSFNPSFKAIDELNKEIK